MEVTKAMQDIFNSATLFAQQRSEQSMENRSRREGVQHPRQSALPHRASRTPIRQVNLTGFFCEPDDPEYAEAAKATGTKGNQAPGTKWVSRGLHVRLTPSAENSLPPSNMYSPRYYEGNGPIYWFKQRRYDNGFYGEIDTVHEIDTISQAERDAILYPHTVKKSDAASTKPNPRRKSLTSGVRDLMSKGKEKKVHFEEEAVKYGNKQPEQENGRDDPDVEMVEEP